MATLADHAILWSLREKWRRTLRKRRSLIELAGCPPNELHRVAQDVGLSASELRAIGEARAGPGELLPRRLQLLGLDREFVRSAQTVAYWDMERTCAICKVWRLCARDLVKGDAQGGMDTYCLNAEAIDALTVDQTRRRPT
jgi:hypothetical protein